MELRASVLRWPLGRHEVIVDGLSTKSLAIKLAHVDRRGRIRSLTTSYSLIASANLLKLNLIVKSFCVVGYDTKANAA